MRVDVPANFTLQELVAHLREEGQRDLSEYHTVREWTEILGVGLGRWETRMRELIREGLDRGIVERARTSREAIDGTLRPTTVYAFRLKEDGEREEGGQHVASISVA